MPENINEILDRKLTPTQKAAAVDPTNEILCLACAGSGKSRTLAYRIARLLADGESPESILAFTFTDKAAESIKRRVSEALSEVGIDQNVLGAMYIGTIHSFCQSILGQIDAVYRQFDVLDENRLKLYIISRYPQLGLAALKPRARGGKYFDAIKKLSDAWTTLNDELFEIDEVRANDAMLGQVLTALRDSLRRDQFIDFSSMIRFVVDALRLRNRGALAATAQFRHLMVDEYQDVSPSQEELIRQLHLTAPNLFVVGDDDQSIYAWRGADVSNILGFRARYANSAQHSLLENFRSTSAIVAVSDGFIAAELGPSRIAKNPTANANLEPRDIRTVWYAC